MTDSKADRRHLVRAIADTVAAAAVAAWVGGHVALGAFGARIAFRDLPRPEAAQTMTTIFRSFDGLADVAIVLLAVAVLARVAVLGGDALRGAHLVFLAASVALVVVGTVGAVWVHPSIERMFRAGDTGSEAFVAAHTLSERLAHLEGPLALLVFGGLAFRRPRREEQG